MSDGRNHILADSESGDCCPVGEGGFVDYAAVYSLIEGLLKPHLAKRKRLMPGKVRGRSLADFGRGFHATILASDGSRTGGFHQSNGG